MSSFNKPLKALNDLRLSRRQNNKDGMSGPQRSTRMQSRSQNAMI
jgi:hypothetical protein